MFILSLFYYNKIKRTPPEKGRVASLEARASNTAEVQLFQKEKWKLSKHKLLTKKKVILLLILLCVAIIATWYTLGCNGTDFEDASNIDIGDLTTNTDIVLPVPDDGTTPADHDPTENYYIALGNLRTKGSFITEGSGSSNALFVKQYVKSKRIVTGGEAYKMSSSSSDFVSVAKEIYVSGDTYLTRNASKVKSLESIEWGNDATKIGKEAFLKLYGSVPDGICNYIINGETVLSARYTGTEDGLYRFEYDLDTEKATPRIKLEMRTMAGTKSLPVFNKATFIIYLDDCWNVVKTMTDSSYDVDMLGGVTCNEKLTETFYSLGESVSIPNAEYYRSFIGADVTDDNAEAFTPDVTYYLTNGFTDYMSGTPLNALLTLKYDDLSVSGNARVDLDINNLTNLKLKALLNVKYGDVALNDVFVGYENDTVYLAYGALKLKCSVSEATEAIGALLDSLGIEFPDLSSLSFDTDALLKNATLERTNGFAYVELPVVLGDIEASVVLSFADNDTPLFAGITARATGLTVDVLPFAGIEYDYNYADFANALSLLDIIDDKGNICLAIDADPICALVNINLQTLVIDVNLGELSAKYQSGVVYVKYKDIEAGISVSELSSVIDKFSPLLGDITNENELLSALLGELEQGTSLADVINGLELVKNDNRTMLTARLGKDISATINLITTEKGYELFSVVLTVKGKALSVTPASYADMNVISDVSAYCNLLPLLDVINDSYEINATVSVAGISADICFNIKDMSLLAKATIFGKQLYARYDNNRLYVSFLGLDAYVSIDEVSDVVKFLSPLFGEELDLENMLSGFTLDVDSIISSISTTKTADTLTLALPLGDVDLSVILSSTNGKYTLSKAIACIGNTDITVAPSAKASYSAISDVSAYCDLLPLLDVINGAYNIPLKISIGATDIAANINLSTLSVNVKYGDIEALIELNDMTAYVQIGEIKLSLNLNDITAILEELKPTLNKLLPQDIADMLDSLDLSSLADINVDSLISSITTEKTANGSTLTIPIDGVGLTVALSSANGKYTLLEIVADIDGTELSITPAEATDFAGFDIDETFVDVKNIVDMLAGSINDIICNDNLSITLAGSISSSTSAITITDGEVSVLSMSNEPDVAIKLNLLEQTLNSADGSVTKERTHTLTIVYKNKLVYFNYNGLEGKFGIDKLTASKQSIQEIIGNIPELRDLITQYIELSDDNWLAPIDIDILPLLGALTYNDGTLALKLTDLSSVMDILPNELSLSLTAADNAITLSAPAIALGDMTIELTATASGASDEKLSGKFDYTESSSCNDFSSIDTLLATLAQTTGYRNFELSGTVDISMIKIINIKDNVHISAKIDIIDGKTYAVVSLKRDYVVGAWEDYDGTATLYYDPIGEMIYIEDIHRTRELNWFKYEYTTHYDYSKYTVDEFLEDMITPLLGMMHFSSLIEKQIQDAIDNPADTSEAYIENIFTGYSYDEGAKKFNINLDLGPLTDGDIGATSIELTHNDDYDLTTLLAKMTVIKIIDIKLNATHVESFGHYNGADTAVMAQIVSGNYN